MTTTLITFKVLAEGRVRHKTISFEHNFEVIPAQTWNNLTLPSTSVEEQVMDWLDRQDKTTLMQKHGWDIILNYWPKKLKIKGAEVKSFARYCDPIFKRYPSLLPPFEIVASQFRQKIFGKRLSNEAKLKYIVDHITSMQTGALAAIDYLAAMLDKQVERLR